MRLTYYRGKLEILAPSPEHELHKTVMGRFVETLAEELDINIYPLGSTTYKHPELSGAEPDECFYIRNIAAIRGKRRVQPSDPPSDLFIEIDITSSILPPRTVNFSPIFPSQTFPDFSNKPKR